MTRPSRSIVVALFASLLLPPLLHAQRAGQPPGQRGAPPPPPPAGGQSPSAGRGGRGGGGRGNIQVMTLTTTAWTDGGQIPAKYTQAGPQVSPPLAWSNVPEGIISFVLVVHDLDAATAPGTDDILHWLVWNIPAAVRS